MLKEKVREKPEQTCIPPTLQLLLSKRHQSDTKTWNILAINESLK